MVTDTAMKTQLGKANTPPSLLDCKHIALLFHSVLLLPDSLPAEPFFSFCLPTACSYRILCENYLKLAHKGNDSELGMLAKEANQLASTIETDLTTQIQTFEASENELI